MKAGSARVRLGESHQVHTRAGGSKEVLCRGGGSDLQLSSGQRELSAFELSSSDSQEEEEIEEIEDQRMTLMTVQDHEAELVRVCEWLARGLNPGEGEDSQSPLVKRALANAATGLLNTIMNLPLDDREVWTLIQEKLGPPPDDFLRGNGLESVDGEGSDERVHGWKCATAPSVPQEHTRADRGLSSSPPPDDSYGDLLQYVVPVDELPCFASIAGGSVPKRVLTESVIYPSKLPHLFQVIHTSSDHPLCASRIDRDFL